MRCTILFFLSLMFFSRVEAQQQLAFPTSEAATLGTYGNIPVSLHTGKVNVSIPLFEITEFNYPLSISLSYNSGGIQAQVRPGWVGLNWTLNAGGAITRSVKGYRDEYYQRGSFNHGYMLNGKEWASYDKMYDYYFRGHDINSLVDDYFYDLEPDEFFFNMNGRSGKFYYENGTFISPGNPGLKIAIDPPGVYCVVTDIVGEYSTDTFRGFTITDETGIVYHFGYNPDLIEMSSTADIQSSTSSGSGVASSWYLSDIEFPNREEKIKFSYYPKLTDLIFSYVQASYGMSRNEAWVGNGALYPCPDCGFSGSSYIDQIYKIYQHHTYLKEIEGANFKLKFAISKANDMIFAPHEEQRSAKWQKLSGITLERKEADGRTSVVRGYSFSYLNGERYRLPLAAVYETDKNGVKNPTGYKIEYNTPDGLPGYSFTGIDHWGYYNGTTGSLLEPKPGMTRYYPRNRDSSPKHMQYGSLRSIEYPTGGKTLFEFEANTYSTRYVSDDQIHHTEETYWEDHVFTSMNDTLWIEEDALARITIVHETYIGVQRDSTEKRMTKGMYLIGEFMDRTFGWGGFDTFTISIKKTIIKDEIIPGVPSIRNGFAGGLRIKRMIDISAPAARDSMIREYQYTKNNTQESSGVIGRVPTYYYAAQNGNIAFGALSVQSFSPLSYTEGSHIGYSEVKELLKDHAGNQLGYNVYKYTNFNDYPDLPPTARLSIMSLDIGTGNTREPYRGKLLSKTSYNAQGEIVYKKKYTYSTVPNSLLVDNIRGMECKTVIDQALKMSSMSGPYFKNVTPAFEINAFEIPACGYKITSETETLYDVHGDNPHSTTIRYTYNPYELPSVTTESGVLKTTTLYPFDFDTEFYRNMVEEYNMLNYSIKQTSEMDGQISDRKWTTYRATEGDYKHLMFCDKVFGYDSSPMQLTSATSEHPEVEFLAYDKSGNPLEVKDHSGLVTVYIWGYRRQFLIAEIKNATLERVKGLLGIDIDILGVAAVPDMNKINALRAKMPEARITTCTYFPLVGIRAKTDEKDITVTYEYDDFGRLSGVRNEDGKLLKALEYNYKH